MLLQVVTIVPGFELVGPSKHGFVSVVIMAFNSVGMMILALLGLVFSHWRSLQLAVSVPGVVMSILYLW